MSDEVKTEVKEKVKTETKRAISDVKPGMTVRVYQKIKEQNAKGEWKERVQYFEGIVLAAKHGREAGASFNVYKVSDGVGVEKIFPLHSPTITKIEIKKQAKVRRAKLYFLKRGHNKRLKLKGEKSKP
ncbi:50S ribosomal protein L19 [Candidatus Falkowbacteria bacterium RIFCSPLOWO2_12_FULL_45_10]|uniref:50S ribosomal protein L19 n=3 Tax=Candidatus Falkowiibacteriota TaxID=1752728 RepID=A0A1F5RMX4_9BACT|nr:MAG: 50S ribosomal protein L19 [Candidatus Falkowbacteria bacterium RIFCSPHIGHO2_02_FULL_45_15]OGF18413.1 MAG: 50S ribosomal protein L19 [Candidatus Falkowbacteria bacterium RIFCSPLOWO2_12_FULL_45_10]OGF19653.1 MAG: 50S ribosomal protein L19 [Candidatus Falkowbacteria bacterium RIFCSPLOWO2_02_FULL_45_15]